MPNYKRSRSKNGRKKLSASHKRKISKSLKRYHRKQRSSSPSKRFARSRSPAYTRVYGELKCPDGFESKQTGRMCYPNQESIEYGKNVNCKQYKDDKMACLASPYCNTNIKYGCTARSGIRKGYWRQYGLPNINLPAADEKQPVPPNPEVDSSNASQPSSRGGKPPSQGKQPQQGDVMSELLQNPLFLQQQQKNRGMYRKSGCGNNGMMYFKNKNGRY